MPVGFEISSNMHMYHASDNHIYSFSSMTTYLFLFGRYVYISFSLFMPVTFEIVHTLHLYKILMAMKCQVTATLFYICKLYLFLVFCDPLGIPCLAVILVFFCIYQWNIYCTHNYIIHLVTIFILQHQWQLLYSLSGWHISFSFFLPLTFEIIHACVPIHSTNAYYMTVTNIYLWQQYFFFYISVHLYFSCLKDLLPGFTPV